MKSVGEAMAIGRSFPEALQKALRSLENPAAPLSWAAPPGDRAELLARCAVPHDGRMSTVHQALRAGASVAEPGRGDRHRSLVRRPDRWPSRSRRYGSGGARPGRQADAAELRAAKAAGFSDAQIGQLHGPGRGPGPRRCATRSASGRSTTRWTPAPRSSRPARRTCTRRTTRRPRCRPATRPKVIILGSGPNRIGQGIEFDYACVHASFALTAAGYETVMVNCNPETVSTDYDTSGRLYFEPLTLEDVLEVVHAERQTGPVAGVIVQLGGQTPLGLAPRAGRRGRAGRRHLAGRDPPGRGPRRVRRGAGRGRAARAAVRHRAVGRRGAGGGGRDRLPGAGPAVLRARRPGHGDRLRRRRRWRPTWAGPPRPARSTRC